MINPYMPPLSCLGSLVLVTWLRFLQILIPKVSIQNKKEKFVLRAGQTKPWFKVPPPNTMKECLNPIKLGLTTS